MLYNSFSKEFFANIQSKTSLTQLQVIKYIFILYIIALYVSVLFKLYMPIKCICILILLLEKDKAGKYGKQPRRSREKRIVRSI